LKKIIYFQRLFKREIITENYQEISKNNNLFLNGRGKGNFHAFSFETPEILNKFVNYARNNGIFLAACGLKSCRLRPSLIVENRHYDFLLNVMRNFKI